MNRLVATGRPASALLKAHSVIGPSDEQSPATDLLEVAFQAEVRVTNGQHLGVHRAVRIVTHDAAFAHGFMLENKRPALGGMTANAGFVCRHQ